ncbi:MAG: DNA repair protein RecN [Clostridia bacterium]|nr:DNA repair protein RecN [Clostridia bacterium]
MLTCLYVENIAIIKQISIDFSAGFTILTGETGAGKSILIDSIGLLLGNKARKELIGSFGDYAYVKAQFSDLAAEVLQILSENDISVADGEVFIERKISKDGRSTAKINMVQVPISFLQSIAPFLINIHGQHDHILILNSALHIEFLDKYAQLEKDLLKYRDEYAKLRTLRKELQELSVRAEQRESRLNHLSFKLQEYERVSPCVGMLAYLQEKKKLLQNQKAITDFLASIHFGDDKTLASVIGDALSKADKLVEVDERFKEIYVQLEQMQELAASVIIQGEDVVSEFDLSETLTDVEDKIYELQQLLSHYGPTEEDLLVDWEETQKEFEQINSLDDTIAKCQEAFVAQRSVVQNFAEQISAKRKKSAEVLGKHVQKELSFLDMNGVQFEVNVQANQNTKGGFVYNDNGFDRVEFLISTNRGQPAKPLNKIASGGELSRIMLSLTNVLNKQQVGTMIFDEVDTGVSGKTAEKIGVKLKEVAASRQVLCITHLAQIASMGNHHYKIQKSTFANVTETTVDLLDHEARIDEIARIIGGINITDTVRDAAQEMLLKQ